MSVPPSAQFVAGPLALGDASPAADVPKTTQHVLYAVHCEQDVVVVSTTRETLYAELPCSRVLADEVFRPFLSLPVLIRVYGAGPRQLSLASGAIGSLAFEVAAYGSPRREDEWQCTQSSPSVRFIQQDEGRLRVVQERVTKGRLAPHSAPIHRHSITGWRLPE